MSDVSEHFIFLSAEAGDVAGTQLLTRAVGLEVGSYDVLVALDAGHQKHLLIPLSGDTVENDQASQGVALGSRTLRVRGSDVSFADLHCLIPSLDLVFERLVEDVLIRLSQDPTGPVTTCRRVLGDWRALLKTAGQDLSQETIIGLVGELEVLRILAKHNPSGAMDAWRGPTKSVHDFVRKNSELEVKTVTSVDGNFVSISNIDQLDPTLVDSLHLVVVHLREDLTAPSIDERMDELTAMGVPRDQLLRATAQMGYVYEAGPSTLDRYHLRSVRAWKVDTSFPGLRRHEIGEQRLRGVGRIRYELALDSAPRRLTDPEFLEFVRTWLAPT